MVRAFFRAGHLRDTVHIVVLSVRWSPEMSIFPPDPTELCPFHCDCAAAFAELAALRAKLAQAETREVELRSANARWAKIADERSYENVGLKSALSTAREEAEAMREALRPFANAAVFFDQRYLDGDSIIESERPGEHYRLEVGDLRKAQAVLWPARAALQARRPHGEESK